MNKIIYNHPKRKEIRRNLRKNSTKEEDILWDYLRNNKLGFKFKRQYGISGYIIDFYCSEKRLAIELDGEQHKNNKEYDNIRTKLFEALDIKVLRFWNSELIKNLNGVIEKIKGELK